MHKFFIIFNLGKNTLTANVSANSTQTKTPTQVFTRSNIHAPVSTYTHADAEQALEKFKNILRRSRITFDDPDADLSISIINERNNYFLECVHALNDLFSTKFDKIKPTLSSLLDKDISLNRIPISTVLNLPNNLAASTEQRFT